MIIWWVTLEAKAMFVQLMQAHGGEMGGAMEGLPGPVKKAASDLLNKQGGSTSVAVTAGNGRSHAPAPVAAEPAPSGEHSAAPATPTQMIKF